MAFTVLLFIATLAPTGRFLALAFPSSLLHPWIVRSALLVMRLRRGVPSDVAYLNRGEGGISPFPLIAGVSSLLTFTFVQGRVRREPGPRVIATPGMP
jgi:hypothetical protein